MIWPFNKLKTYLIRQYIEREVGKMTEFLKPILDLIKALVQPSQGTKFLVTIAGFGMIYLLATKDIGGVYAIPVVGVIIIAYYAADIYHKPKTPALPVKEGDS